MEKKLDFNSLYAFQGKAYDESEIKEALENIGLTDVNCYDTCVDDGGDEEDEYVMKACFEGFDEDGGQAIVRVYYGSDTYKIGYISVS